MNFIDGGVHYGKGLAETFLGPVCTNYHGFRLCHSFIYVISNVSVSQVLKTIPRNAYYISTKVGRCGNHFNYTPTAISESFEKSLERLQLEYVDIVFVRVTCLDAFFFSLMKVNINCGL